MTSCHFGFAQINSWKTFQMPEYGLEFKYPPAGSVDNKLDDTLFGEITVDGFHRWPYSIKLYPQRTTKVIQGVVFKLPIRFIMLTDAAKMDPDSAKDFHWNEAPGISLYPFDYERNKQSLLNAVERLYLGRPRTWMKIEPIRIDGKTGIKMSDWDVIINEKYFEEIVAVPVSTNKILIIQAGYFPQSGFFSPKIVTHLKTKQQIFSDVVSSVKFLKK
jgi:hypothetical protein